MEHAGIKTVKKAYEENQRRKGNLKRAEELAAADETSPVFSGLSAHPEDEPSTETINRAFEEISIDLTALSNELGYAAVGYRTVIENVDRALKNADAEINRQKEMLEEKE